MKSTIYLLLVFFNLLPSCKKKADERYTKVWYDTEYRVPGKSILEIKADFTFSYKSSGCQWRSISYGKWYAIRDGLIELNSTESDKCYNMFLFAECLIIGENRKAVTTIPNCIKETETSFIKFKKEIFKFKNDSLIYIHKSNSKCPPLYIKFAKTEKF